MSTTRNNPKKKFSIVPNQSILDMSISNGAFRVLCYILSKPDNWNINNTDVKKQLKIVSNDTLPKYWKELINSGWVTRKRKIDENGKSKGGFEYHINSEVPILRIPKKQDSLKVGFPKIGTLNNTDYSNTDNSNKEKRERKPQTPKGATLTPSQKLLIKQIGKSQFKLVTESSKAKALTPDKKKMLIEYLQHRKDIKKPLKTERSISAYCNKFNAYSVGDIRKVLNMTLDEGWTGLIWDKLNQGKSKSDKVEFAEPTDFLN